MRPASVIASRYEIVRMAGRGGMGTVYQARDLQTAELVAVKVIRTDRPDLMMNLVREARTLGELNHPGIVRYLSHGLTSIGEPFLVMEWLAGEDLGQRLRRGPLGVAETRTVARLVCEALSAAHRRGIVHRDIKPANLFLLDENVGLDTLAAAADLGAAAPVRLKVLDFGIALLERSGPSAIGRVFGTPGFIAPEQARGALDVDARADLFALGCVIFACLTQRPPFVGDSPQAVLAKILLDEPPRLRELRADVPAELDSLVATMLAKDPTGRPADPAAVAAALAATEDTVYPSSRRTASGQPVLGREEQHFVSVLVAGARAGAAPDGLDPRLQELAEAHGARFEPMADGALVAGFAASTQATDLAARAARCALGLRRLLPDAPMVLATGRGVVERGAVLGAVIDRATALLAQGATGGAVRVDDVTAGLLELRFELGRDPVGPFLLEERGLVAGARPLLGRRTACVGRERELATLRALCEEALGESEARVALVTGPAGSGKSRLRLELLDRVAADEIDCQIWIGRGDPMTSGSPLAVLGGALQEPMGFLPSDEPAVRRAKIQARVARSFTGADLARTTEFLAEICGAPFASDDRPKLQAARQDPVLMGDQIRRAFEDWLGAELRAQPVILVLEDLHWGDWPSLKLIDSALRSLADRPLFVLGLGRPDLLELFGGVWAERRLEHIRLRELSRTSCERLVRQVLGAEVAPEVVARITQRSQGNPFYLEELIRSVAEGGGDELPETVLAMVDARLGRLPPELRQVLRAASLFGEVFWEGGVAALLGEDEAMGLRQLLGELAEREWLVERRDGRFSGQVELAFGHSLLREAAYATLTGADRALGHRQVARWLESAGEQNPVVLAEHHQRGGQLARACTLWRQAAEQALEGNDFEATLARVGRALSLGAEGALRGALRLLQAEAHNWRTEHAQAEPCALEALALLPRGSDPWASAVHHAAWALRVAGKGDALAALADELRQVFGARQSGPLVVSLAAVVIKLIEAGLYPQASALMEVLEASPVAQGTDQAIVGAWVANARAYRASVAGHPDQMLRWLRGSVESWETAGDERNVCVSRNNIAVACLELGAFDEAERELRAALTAAERLGIAGLVDGTRQNLGWALACRGALDEARGCLLAAVEGFRLRGDGRYEGISLMYLAQVELGLGQPARAASTAAAAVERLHASPSFRAYALAVRARILVSEGDTAAALAAAREAMAVAAELGGLEEGDAFVRLVAAKTLAAAGETEAARQAILAARARIEERALHITDPAWRRSFLERVPENARTLELARSWAG